MQNAADMISSDDWKVDDEFNKLYQYVARNCDSMYSSFFTTLLLLLNPIKLLLPPTKIVLDHLSCQQILYDKP